MRPRLRRAGAVAVLLAFESAALAAAVLVPPTDQAFEWRRPGGWLATATPEAVGLEVGRAVLLAVGGWLLLTTLAAVAVELGVALGRSGPGAGRAALGRVTPALVRRVVEGTLAVGIVTGTITPVAPLGPLRSGRAPVSATGAQPRADLATHRPEVPAEPAPPNPVVATRVVAPGESLWSIARDEILTRTGATDLATVTDYWRALCDRNRDALQSRDLNVVVAGETVVLP